MRFISVLLFFTLCQCGYEHTGLPEGPGKTGSGKGQDSLPAELSFELLKAEVFQPYCFTCHSNSTRNAAGVNLETYAAVFPNLALIREAVASGFMPRGSSLPEAQKQLLYTWVDAGAPEVGNGMPVPPTNPGPGQPTPPPECDDDDDGSPQATFDPNRWVPIEGDYYFDQQTKDFVIQRRNRGGRNNCDDN